MLGDLSARYESNGDGACISTGFMDPGGVSYGAYQLSSKAGMVQAFVQWLGGQHDAGRQALYNMWSDALCAQVVPSLAFNQQWQYIGITQREAFLEAQHGFVKETFYDVGCEYLRSAGFHVEKHSPMMRDVIWSRAVQYGPAQVVPMWLEAVQRLGYPNLSYIDAEMFDGLMMQAIYEVCMQESWTCASLRESLRERFQNESKEAIAAWKAYMDAKEV